MKKLVVLVAGLLSVALFAQAEETQNTKENTFSMKVQIRPRAETGSYSPGLKMPSPPGLSITVPAFLWGMSGIVCLSVCPRNMLAYGGRILKSIRMVVLS